MTLTTAADAIGHNSRDVSLRVELRLFNSLTRFGGEDGSHRLVSLPAGSTVADLLRRLAIPAAEIFLVLVNGRDITPTLLGAINTHRCLEDGDVVALSGPVPFSWGYGAPVI